MVGKVAFEQAEVGVKGISQVKALDQQAANAQAAKAAGAELLGVIVVDVLVAEEPSLVFLPLPPTQAVLQPTLAIPHLLVYAGFHLKLLGRCGAKTMVLIRLFPASPEEFQAYVSPSRNSPKTDPVHSLL